MKNLLLFLVCLFLIIGCNDSQEDISIVASDCLVLIDSTWSLITLDQPPNYLDNGTSGFGENLLTEIEYPMEARENDIEGPARIEYEITITGRVENIQVVEDPGTGIGEELKRAFEVVTTGVAYSPAILDGNVIGVKKDLELLFRLE